MLTWLSTRKRKKILGYLTVWPFIYPIIFIGIFILVFGMLYLTGAFTHKNNPYIGYVLIPIACIVIPLHIFTFLSLLVLMILYLIDALSNEKISSTPKIIWALGMFSAGQIAQIGYWYFYIWNTPILTLENYPGLSRLFKNTNITTRKQKILLGIWTLMPLVIMILFVFMMFTFMIYMATMGDTLPKDEPPPAFFLLFLFCFLGMMINVILLMGLHIYYLKDILKRTTLTEEKKQMWIPLSMLYGLITLPIYWYCHVWKDGESNSIPKENVNV